MRSFRPRRQAHRGVVMLGVLLLMFNLGFASLVAFHSLRIEREREKEQELLMLGSVMMKAIQAYVDGSPAGIKELPRALEDLIEDKRHPVPKRHLRSIPFDPFTSSQQWGLVRAADRLIGVHSMSNHRPWKRANFSEGLSFVGKTRISEWTFQIAPPPVAPVPPAAVNEAPQSSANRD
jgi:type II secretory pathway pseudopilin PulG